jgi:predicted nucleic acid-binding protein
VSDAPAVCLDASFVVKLALWEEDTPNAQAMLQRWLEEGIRVVGPATLMAESCSVARTKVHRGLVSPLAGRKAIATLLSLDIELVPLSDHYLAAWALADRLCQPTLYDCYYLAVAEACGCEFWTADRALFRACRPTLPWVRLLGSE